MRPLPPRDEDDLLARARALAGRTLGNLATELGISLSTDAARTKGKAGDLVERALGATGGSLAVRDFPHLGIELKTIPVDEGGRPRESTFVCVIALADADRAEWASSWVRSKLACVLWVPIVTVKGWPVHERTIATPVLWRPTAEQDAVLAGDFDDIMGRIGVGGIEGLTARTGRFLQARPKAAHGRVRTLAYGPDDERIAALPRGFYLRARFTGAILRDPAALPD